MNVQVRVLNLDNVPDSDGQVFDPAGVHVPEEPVPVMLNYDKTLVVGTAKLRKLDDCVVAILDLDTSGKLFDFDFISACRSTPGVQGRVNTNACRVFNTVVIDDCTITGIGLHRLPNADPRIMAIGRQVCIPGDPVAAIVPRRNVVLMDLGAQP